MTDQLLKMTSSAWTGSALPKERGCKRGAAVLGLFAFLMAASSRQAMAQVSRHSVPALYPDARHVDFDLRTGHPFVGLATVIWPGAPFAAQRHDVMLSTRMSWVRIPLMNSFREGDERPGMSVQQLLAQRGNHPVRTTAEHMSPQQLQTLRMEDQRTSERYRGLGEELRAVGIHFIIAALPGFPKSWMQTFQYQGSEYRTFMSGQPGQPDHRQDYVTLVVAEIIAARQAGLGITGVEMPFEPDEPGAGMKPDVANSMVGKLRNTLNQNGLANVEIASPGTGSTLSAARWITAMQGKGGHIEDVKYFAVHDYDSAKLPAPVGLSSSFLRATRRSKPILVTEFNDDSPRWSKPPYLGSPRSSPPEEGLSPANAANHSEFATSVVAEALKLVSDGANGICVWEMNDIYWKKTSYGLIDLHGNARPTVTAFATWMNQIGRESEVQAYGTDAGPGLAAAAFQITRDHQKSLIVVLANVTNKPIRTRLSLQHQDEKDGLSNVPFARIAAFPSGGSVEYGTALVPANGILVLSNVPAH